jgi:hypothetical protein
MNFFVFLLSFYMLTLSCFPCGDSEECNAKDKQEVSSTSGDHEHETEGCTPFCSCACCSSTAFCTGMNTPKYIALASEQVIFSGPPEYFDSYNAHAVWQPPRA